MILPVTILGILVKTVGLSTHFWQGFSVILKKKKKKITNRFLTIAMQTLSKQAETS